MCWGLLSGGFTTDLHRPRCGTDERFGFFEGLGVSVGDYWVGFTTDLHRPRGGTEKQFVFDGLG